MFRRIVCSASMLAALAGCRGAQNFHGDIEFTQWTPQLTSSARRGAGNRDFNLVNHGGVATGDAFLAFDASLRFQTGSGGRAKPHAVNLGYWQHTYAGTGNASGVTFAGVPLTGSTRTTADFKLYKLTYEEPGLTQGGDGRTGGTLGLHLIDFNIRADAGGGNVGIFVGTAPMLVIGWKIAYYSKGLMYYFGVEGMDLDVVSLSNITGGVTETVAGVRWFLGDTVALSVGWRSYEANLIMRGDTLNIKQEGASVTLYVKW